MYELDENSIIIEIQNEYKKIDDRWMKLHYYTLVSLMFFGFLVECLLGLAWYQSGHVEISRHTYVLKYIWTPLLLNSILTATGILVMHLRLKQKTKIYYISLLVVGICFVFYTIHSMFSPLFLIFTVPVLLTIIYSDYRLTTITASASIAAKIIADLCIVWDPEKVDPLASAIGIINLVISVFLLCLFYVACIIVIRFEKEKNAASIQKEIEHYQTQKKLHVDELTNIYNRTALRKAFQRMINDTSGSTYFFAMMDIDNFKTLNDTFGHDKGDIFLEEFADILKRNCGYTAIPFRFGGDEFCLLYKGVPLDSVVSTCRHIQQTLKKSQTSISYMSMTASFGIAVYDGQMTASQLLKNTDAALYRAKETRNSIYVYADTE